MTNNPYSVPVALTQPTDYAAQLAELERRRQYAALLSQQSIEPLQQLSVGGVAGRNSWTQVLAKLLQGGLGGYERQQVEEGQKNVAQQYQNDLIKTIELADKAGKGVPATPPEQLPEDVQGPPAPGSPAIPGSPELRAAILMRHPLTQAIGQTELQDTMRRAALIQAFAQNGNPQASPSQPPAPDAAAGTSAAAPWMQQNQPAPSSAMQPGGIQNLPPAGGIPAAAWLSQDPSGKSYMEQRAKDNAPISTRYGIFTQDKNNPGQYAPAGGALPQGALPYQFGPNGQPDVRPYPGQVAGTAALAGAQAGARAGAEMPYGTAMTKVPVYLPGGDQITVDLNPVQMHQYNTTQQLPPEIAASIPGLPQNTLRLTAPSDESAKAIGRQLDAQRIPYSISVTSGASPQPQAGPPVIGRTQSQSEQITQERQRAGGKSMDEAFGKDLGAFIGGGAQDATRQLVQLGDTIKALAEPGNSLTGPVVGRLPDAVRNITNPQAVAMRERVEEVVQRSLRSILGAQFTENEGKRLIDRAYNPAQPPQENAIRVGRLYTQLQSALQQKLSMADYFQKNGTLQGWQGKAPSISDFDPQAESPQPQQPVPTQSIVGAPPPGAVRRVR